MARICISTLDPTVTGGVSTMAKFVYETAEDAGHDPYLAFNRLDLSKDIRPWDVPVRGLSVTPTETTINGMEVKHVPRVLPEFEFYHYVLNGDAWRTVIDEADICFAVGGNNQCAHPFVRNGRKFGCWVATPLWGDRVDRIRASSFPLRIRDRLSKPFLDRIERDIYQEAELIYSLSEHTAEAIVSECGANAADVDVVPYPVDTEKFSPKNGDNMEPTVLFVGRFTDPRKNTEMLLDAFARVQQEVPNATLRLIGDEPTETLRSKVDELELADAVEFVDYIDHDDLPKHYREADVFVIPSNQEGLAIVGLEAMASGIPVVSTQCGGPEDYVADNETGALVPRDNPAAMAAAIVRLLTDAAERKRLGETAREVAEERFARDKLTTTFLEAFDELANYKP